MTLDNERINYIPVENLERTGLVRALYTLKSTSEWKINFDDPDDYSRKSRENYSKLAQILGTDSSRLVRCDQTHTANVEIVTSANAGEGVTRPICRSNVDGMITNEKGMLLCTLEADCVPVYFLDPVKKAIGMVHSGWKGTAARIAEVTVGLMADTYGTDPGDIIVCTGPCICRTCYEVSEDLIAPFSAHFSQEEMNSFFKPKDNGKYLLDLVGAIRTTLLSCGVRGENISSCGICTFHDERLCSYRRDKEPTLRMLTAIMLVDH